jgi:hypothetical protein
MFVTFYSLRYGSYEDHVSVFDRYVKTTDAILQIGCGNSALAEQVFA